MYCASLLETVTEKSAVAGCPISRVLWAGGQPFCSVFPSRSGTLGAPELPMPSEIKSLGYPPNGCDLKNSRRKVPPSGSGAVKESLTSVTFFWPCPHCLRIASSNDAPRADYRLGRIKLGAAENSSGRTELAGVTPGDQHLAARK